MFYAEDKSCLICGKKKEKKGWLKLLLQKKKTKKERERESAMD